MVRSEKLLKNITPEPGCSIYTVCYYNSNTDYISISTRFKRMLGYNNGSKINKKCTNWLGDKAEIVLMNMFNTVKRCPRNHQGYDFICGNGYKIDAKASCFMKRKPNTWTFVIKKNVMADFFLCLAFDNRKDLNPLHIWMLPGHILNHLSATSISKSTLDKWSEYEQPLDKVISCCDIMKNGDL